jgi:hypothetical protein
MISDPAFHNPPHPMSRLAAAITVLICVLTWALAHNYRGIFHDAGLYTLQAMAHANPDSLSQDVFLKHGSQDRFTIFSSLYATAGRVFGIEPAAAVLTFVLQLSLFAAAWMLGRAISSPTLALFGLAVLIAIPGDYGAFRIFACVEPFITPRMAAEALTLASVASAFYGRKWIALAFMATALAFHPIMAAAGIAAFGCLYIAIPRPRIAIALSAIVVAALVAVALLMPICPLSRFDNTWLTLVTNRSPYLFVSHWKLDDWSHAIVSMTVLTVGVCALPASRARLLCQSALMTTLSGLALTFIACDLLRLVLLTQLQPWRWQWFGTIVAALLLPMIVRSLWQRGTAGHATTLLLAAAWIFAVDQFSVITCAITLLSLPLFRRLTEAHARLVFWGACAMVGIAVAWRIASNLEFTDAYYLDTHMSLALRRTMSFAHDGAAPIALLLLLWWLGRRSWGRYGLIAVGVLGIVGAAAAFPQIWATWTAREFPPQLVAQFASLRDRIPPGSQVFWPESTGLNTWMLLDRPNYISGIQTSGMVFSRAASMELAHRASALGPFVSPSSFLDWNYTGVNLELSRQQLQGICRLGAFEFLVTSAELQISPVAAIPRKFGHVTRDLKLYRCAPQAWAAAAT